MPSLISTINASVSSAVRDFGRTHTQSVIQQTFSAPPTQGTVSSVDSDGIASVKLADGSVATGNPGFRTVGKDDPVDVVGGIMF